MTSARYVLDILHRLLLLSPESLQRLLRARSIAVDTAWPALELATALAQPAAIAAHLEQLSAQDIDLLERARASSDETLQQSALETLLVTHLGDSVAIDPEVEGVFGALRGARKDSSSRSKTLPPRESRAQGDAVDLTQVGGYLEWLEKIAASAGVTPFDIGAQESTGALAEANAALPCAMRVGLVVPRAGRLWLSSWGSWWMSEDLASRWESVAQRWWARSPQWWRASAEGHPGSGEGRGLGEWVLDHYPLLATESLEQTISQAEGLGILRAGSLTPIGIALLVEGDLAGAINHALPVTTSQVFPDGPDSVIAAGRLEPSAEKTLRRLGTWQSGALTVRFQITPASVIAALQEGWLADDIIDALQSLLPESAMGALVHDISHVIAQASSLRLTPQTSRCELTTDDPVTLAVIGADYHLSQLSWRSESGKLVTGWSLAQVDRALSDAGYWHIVMEADGKLRVPETRWTCVGTNDEAEWNPQSIDALRRSLAEQESQPLFWEEPLGLAISQRVSLRVTVQVGSETKVFTLEPMGMSNGRLRAKDVRAEVERTIPLNQVLTIEPGSP